MTPQCNNHHHHHSITKIPLLLRIFSFVDCCRVGDENIGNINGNKTGIIAQKIPVTAPEGEASASPTTTVSHTPTSRCYFDKFVQLSTVTATWREAFVIYGAGCKSLRATLHNKKKNIQENEPLFRAYLIACENGYLWMVQLFTKAGIARDAVVWRNDMQSLHKKSPECNLGTAFHLLVRRFYRIDIPLTERQKRQSSYFPGIYRTDKLFTSIFGTLATTPAAGAPTEKAAQDQGNDDEQIYEPNFEKRREYFEVFSLLIDPKSNEESEEEEDQDQDDENENVEEVKIIQQSISTGRRRNNRKHKKKKLMALIANVSESAPANHDFYMFEKRNAAGKTVLDELVHFCQSDAWVTAYLEKHCHCGQHSTSSLNNNNDDNDDHGEDETYKRENKVIERHFKGSFMLQTLSCLLPLLVRYKEHLIREVVASVDPSQSAATDAVVGQLPPSSSSCCCAANECPGDNDGDGDHETRSRNEAQQILKKQQTEIALTNERVKQFVDSFDLLPEAYFSSSPGKKVMSPEQSRLYEVTEYNAQQTLYRSYKIFEFRRTVWNILMDFCSIPALKDCVRDFCDPELGLVDLHLLHSRARCAFPFNGRSLLAQAARLRAHENCRILLQAERNLIIGHLKKNKKGENEENAKCIFVSNNNEDHVDPNRPPSWLLQMIDNSKFTVFQVCEQGKKWSYHYYTSASDPETLEAEAAEKGKAKTEAEIIEEDNKNRTMSVLNSFFGEN